MADLDDFFAKKDRKKSSKGTKKFAANPEELVKQIEDTRKSEAVRPAARKEQQPSLAAATPADGDADNAGSDAVAVAEQPAIVEDEWKEFEAEERKDYTGLKIGQLQIENESDDAAEESAYEKYDSEGELNVDGERQRSGPWNKVDADSASAAGGAAPAAAAAAPEKGGSYVLPALRSGLGGLAQMQRNKLRKGILPDIHDKEYFPVLGAAKPEEVKKKRPDPGFEEVRHGGRIQRSAEISSSAPVSVGNRFGSLADS